ncbi:class A beta-lactamase [Aquabacterium humicola]|uniref:class A beta-lactamase n=1 Tax=Aquabacterium humicola TaxID=3237377 RepID=UPI002542EB79|nr:class A beta-lactamase [Rubrivivax pictus]
MNRRHFQHGLALGLAGATLGLQAQENARPDADPWARIEATSGGRLGIAVLDTATGRLDGHRLDERFPMASTFKWLVAALVLQRVDHALEQLERRIRYGREVLIAHSPVTERHAGAEGITVRALCEAIVTVSDNAGANLLLDSFGGPAALTRFARSLGDGMTRLDRRELALNEARPGDPRDTTTPRAMAGLLNRAVLGDVLSPASRALLVQWLEAARTGLTRLRAALPADWRAGDKTGSGQRGTSNDVAVFWPPQRAPLVVAAYLTGSDRPMEHRNATLAAVGRAVVARVA